MKLHQHKQTLLQGSFGHQAHTRNQLRKQLQQCVVCKVLQKTTAS